MDEMIAFCGLACSQCPGFVATQNDDDEARRKIAEEWSRAYKADIRPEDVNCDGCTVEDGRHITYCSICEIRKCARAQGVDNCAHCPNFTCEKLEIFLAQAPRARENLESVRRESA